MGKKAKPKWKLGLHKSWAAQTYLKFCGSWLKDLALGLRSHTFMVQFCSSGFYGLGFGSYCDPRGPGLILLKMEGSCPTHGCPILLCFVARLAHAAVKQARQAPRGTVGANEKP